MQTQRQADGRRRVVAAGAEPSRQHRREPAAAKAAVAPNAHHPCLRGPVGLRRSPDLPLAKTVAHQHERLSGWLARGAALTAAAGPHLLGCRDFFRPFLDDHRRIDDSFTALSSLHRDRARREITDDQSAVSRRLFLADSASLARSLRARLYLSARETDQSASLPGTALRAGPIPSRSPRDSRTGYVIGRAL